MTVYHLDPQAMSAICRGVIDGYNETVDYGIDYRKVTIDDVIDLAVERELTPQQRECVKLFFFEGYSVKEVAETLNIHRSVVYRNIDSAKKRLFATLKYAYILWQGREE